MVKFLRGEGEPAPIDDWMTSRKSEVEGLPDAETAAREAWAASTLTGANLQAPRPSDLWVLGRSTGQGGAVRRGDKAILSDGQIANIIFNETRSLSGEGVAEARQRLAHAIINGDEMSGPKRPESSPTKATVPPAEAATYREIADAVAAARAQRAAGVDPTNGGRHFNFRPDPSREPFLGYRMRTQAGPFANSNPSPDLPAGRGVYSNVYDD